MENDLNSTNLKQALEKRICSYCQNYNGGEFSKNCLLCNISVVFQTVDLMKTEEQPQGEWGWNEQGYFYCTKCNRQPRDQYAVTNFCPNCGAKMKQG